MSDVSVLFQGNDMLVELSDLRNQATGAYLSTATVQVTVKDSAGVNLTGQAWPLSMPYVTGSNGLYRATLIDTLPLVKNGKYTATITAALGSLNAKWEQELVCKVRNA